MTTNDPNTIELNPRLKEDRRFRRTELPKPYPDPVAWEANLKAALESDPRRKANYERFQQAEKSVDVDYLPIRLDIENVSRCNFRCTMCQVSEWGPKFQRADDMSFEDFKQLVDEQYGLMEIKLHGMGEPLLGRDKFFDMVRYARAKHIWVRTSTNGSLFHLRDNYKKLVDSGINEVQISVDGATKETFEKIRQGSKFELVVKNCRLINEYSHNQNLLVSRMWVVLQKTNLHEFLDFVRLGHEMGFKRLTYSLNLQAWGQEKWVRTNQLETAEDSVSPELAEEAIQLGRRLGLEVTFWNITSKYSTASRETLCPWPFNYAYVSSDMRVVPCCMVANPEVANLGDANDFTASWNSEDYKEFRKDHLEGRIPLPCRICYDNESLKSSSTPLSFGP
ncbi:radical SAM protein [SAR202 cluster bacterium AD-802-F09_MRT_200m]|nr:radical SAM protein [SAR202 cluster bacterium AD-802-F09_MRT_200m]